MKKWAFLAAAVLGMAASGETFTWKPTANALNYRFQDNANWEGGVAPARDGGHDIDMTADTAQLSNGRVGQAIEHISVPYEAISFGTLMPLRRKMSSAVMAGKSPAEKMPSGRSSI